MGGFGGDGSSDRDPASEARLKGKAAALAQAQENKNRLASGPILPLTSNLFERIRNLTRTQCVRDLVICQGR
jgi:hypothetical protein